MSKEVIINAFINAVAEMEINHYDGTYHWHLATDDNNNDWAIVMAYMDYDDDDNEHLYAKIAYQPNNSLMQCDYDIDWLMPYDKKTGDICDTELPVNSSSAKEDIEWLLEQFDKYFDMN